MAEMNYELLNRFLRRAEEISLEVGMDPTVKNIYEAAVKAHGDAYRASFDAIAIAQSKRRKEESEAISAAKALEPIYIKARSAVLAMAPTAVVPKTLSAQTTDTDKLYAIETLTGVIDDYVGAKWADDLLSGDYGTASAKAVKELTEAITANTELSAAITKRAETFGPAYEAFLSFKRVVRGALGSSSKQYRRIHARSGAADDEAAGDAPKDASGAGGEPATPGGDAKPA